MWGFLVLAWVLRLFCYLWLFVVFCWFDLVVLMVQLISTCIYRNCAHWHIFSLILRAAFSFEETIKMPRLLSRTILPLLLFSSPSVWIFFDCLSACALVSVMRILVSVFLGKWAACSLTWFRAFGSRHMLFICSSYFIQVSVFLLCCLYLWKQLLMAAPSILSFLTLDNVMFPYLDIVLDVHIGKIVWEAGLCLLLIHMNFRSDRLIIMRYSALYFDVLGIGSLVLERTIFWPLLCLILGRGSGVRASMRRFCFVLGWCLPCARDIVLLHVFRICLLFALAEMPFFFTSCVLVSYWALICTLDNVQPW